MFASFLGYLTEQGGFLVMFLIILMAKKGFNEECIK